MQGFVGRLFREFGVVLSGAVLISAFVSLSLTPMLNAYMVRKKNGHSRFYVWTEPFFRRLDERYSDALSGFMRTRWMAWAALALVSGMIVVFGGLLQSELAPLEDRSWFRLLVSAPEGSSFEYTDRYMNTVSDLIMDSVPEKQICLTVTAPGFAGSGAVNTGFGRIMLNEPGDRQRSSTRRAACCARCLQPALSLYRNRPFLPVEVPGVACPCSSSSRHPISKSSKGFFLNS
jgi:multidrug efflux pump